MVRKLVLALACVLIFATPALPAAAAPIVPTPPSADSDIQFFPQTGHHLRRDFKRFWQNNGGLDILGLPLTEQFMEDGRMVQYTERARLELWPENPPEFRVLVTRLGAHFSGNRTDGPFAWLAGSPSPDVNFYPESGHTLGGAFRAFWQSRGGLATFGFPISQEFEEVSPTDGVVRLVQYLERARFEYHPDKVGTAYEVQLSQLGRQYMNERPAAQAQAAPVPEMRLLGRAFTAFPGSAYERRQNIARSTAMLDGAVVPAGAVHSFAAAGDFTEANGFVEGYGIVNGRLEKVLGGGLCQVSTTLFRAVSHAGMPIVERVGHAHVVYFYENILGFDATVFTPDIDFRWRNETNNPIYISAIADLSREVVTFELYGVSDGRTVTYTGPDVRNERKPGVAVWQLDPEMPRGAVTHLVHGRSGMDVTIVRTIRWPDGRTRVNRYDTSYAPWEDFFAYGPGVTPPPGVKVIAPKPVKKK